MKNNTATACSFSELKFLDHFLRDHTEDMSIIKAHGFLTAVISFSEVYKPSTWLPLLAGNLSEQPLETARAAQDGLINLYQQIIKDLHSEKEFNFLLSADYPELHISNADPSAIKDWCSGYCLALVWKGRAWLHNEQETIINACTSFFVLAELITTESVTCKKIMKKNLGEIVQSLYVYWLSATYNTLIPNIDSLH